MPAGGATVSFAITRETEPGWDFVFVEAHAGGQERLDDASDLNGHTSQDTGFSCPFWHGLHPFLTHYQTDNGDGTCSPAGKSGTVVGGQRAERRLGAVDRRPVAVRRDRDVEVSISYASDDFVQWQRSVRRRCRRLGRTRLHLLRGRRNTFDGWPCRVPRPGARPTRTTGSGHPRRRATTLGVDVAASFARQREIIDFLSSIFGTYPFSTAGGIVDDLDGLAFALETQTRPVYSKVFWTAPGSRDAVVAHELAHQWYGDSLTVAAWQHIWLNEGFATYAEWLWVERKASPRSQEQLRRRVLRAPPDDDPFWSLTIGDPGPDASSTTPCTYAAR